jgi:RNA polymerase sigma factor (sigma-70 family)
LFTWIYSISINLARNYYVSSQGKKTSLTDSNENLENEVIDLKNPENQLLNDELLLKVNSCLKSMPIDLRTAYSLRVEEQMPYEEISKIMNVPIGTVRSRIFRAREILSKQIEDIL